MKDYLIVFDTNILYKDYEKKADFLHFSFNSTFDNVIGMISQFDIYDDVTVAIPQVVWNEMEKQIIDAHDKKLSDFQSYVKKWVFPEFSINENEAGDFQSFIRTQIEAYRSEIESGLCEVIALPIPNQSRFSRIVERAFSKTPPFGGKEKNSDKGFKDVLLWESILELNETQTGKHILFYTKDNGFKNKLHDEFHELFPDTSISICSTEDEIRSCLEEWAKTIDQFAYTPETTFEEYPKIKEWLKSPDCEIQLIDRDWGLIEKSSIIQATTLHVISFDNIELMERTEKGDLYSVDVAINISYSINNGTTVEDEKDIRIIVSIFDDQIFTVEDAYYDDDAL